MRPLVFANYLAPNMTPVYEFVAARIGQLIGRDTEFVTGTADEQLTEGLVDIAFLCGLPYVRLSGRPDVPLQVLAAPILEGSRYGGRPVYFSDVIVRWDSPYQTFADLRGCSWAHSRSDSFSGCVITRHHLLQMGETEQFFGSIVYSGWHQASLRRVCHGHVDASAIDSHVLGVEMRRHPELAEQVRVIEVLGPSTIPPVVAVGDLPRPTRASIRHAFCALGAEAASQRQLGSGLIQCYAPIEDEAYDDIRHKLAAVEASAAAPAHG